MQFDTLLLERRSGIAFVTLNRPAKLNALNRALITDLLGAARLIAADVGLRAVLLTAAGRAFCAGADLMGEELADVSARSLGANIRAQLEEHFNPMIEAWYGLRIPVVVAVNGVAAGAGVSLALIGDIVMAARSATFLQLFAPKLGLMPDLGSTFHLPRLVGSARAKGLALLGDALSASQAADWGLIWSCVEDESLLAQSEAVVRRLAAGPTQAYERIKKAFNVQPPRTLAEQLAVEAERQGELADTRDFSEGLDAFRHQRAPNFTGA